MHACAGSPTIRTFQDAINNNFLATWPGISKLNMKYLITDHTNIAMGHLDQERANLQSTKNNNTDELEDFEPSDGIAMKAWHNAAILYPFKPKEKTYSDQTGRFLYRSSRGNEYTMVMYDFDANAILVEPLKNRQAK